jgi:predicted nucleic acid-binding protein
VNSGDLPAQEARRFDEEVLGEVLTFFAADRWLRSRAVETVREILSDDVVRVIPQSHESFVSEFDFYAARQGKGYSLADCVSMQTMRREGLSDVLTSDRHFEQEGFARCSLTPDALLFVEE